MTQTVGQIFVGRQTELDELNTLLNKKTATLAVIKGRRRVGKSRLIEEFAAEKRFYSLIGNWPDAKTTAQSQRDEFSRQLSLISDLPEVKADNWYKLFILLAKEVQSGQAIILLDEISWMGSKDSTFLSTLKNVWESHFKKNPELVLILCGSISTWIDENILGHSGYFGRVAWEMTLKPLPLTQCIQFLTQLDFNYSIYEKFKILAITGGIPWYLEQIQGQFNSDENIKRQCFNAGGVLYREFNAIFTDLFGNRSKIYKEIVKALVRAPLEYKALANKVNYKSSGRFSEYLSDLENAGFISKDNTWSVVSKGKMEKSQYRLSDNYLRFYLKYVEPISDKIKRKEFLYSSLPSLPGYETIMGLQFENLILENRQLLWQLCHIQPADIVFNNPYFQNKSSLHEACQIDYLIQTKHNTLYLFEVKFSKNSVSKSVIQQVKQKIERLRLPKNMACLPILIHVNGVMDSLIDENYFFRIIDFGDLVQSGS